MSKLVLILLSSIAFASNAFASWYYNENGGFGIYQPDGWRVAENGRSARLTGPELDRAQSDIFLGSDWIGSVDSLKALKVWVERRGRKAQAVRVSEIDGYRIGSAQEGAIYLLRLPQNIMVIEYKLRGSKDQIDEGQTALSSIEIRTKEWAP